MATVLNTTLKMDGKRYEELTPVGELPAKVKTYAKEHGLLMAVVDPVEDEDEDTEEEEEAPAEQEPEK